MSKKKKMLEMPEIQITNKDTYRDRKTTTIDQPEDNEKKYIY